MGSYCFVVFAQMKWHTDTFQQRILLQDPAHIVHFWFILMFILFSSTESQGPDYVHVITLPAGLRRDWATSAYIFLSACETYSWNFTLDCT